MEVRRILLTVKTWAEDQGAIVGVAVVVTVMFLMERL